MILVKISHRMGEACAEMIERPVHSVTVFPKFVQGLLEINFHFSCLLGYPSSSTSYST